MAVTGRAARVLGAAEGRRPHVRHLARDAARGAGLPAQGAEPIVPRVCFVPHHQPPTTTTAANHHHRSAVASHHYPPSLGRASVCGATPIPSSACWGEGAVRADRREARDGNPPRPPRGFPRSHSRVATSHHAGWNRARARTHALATLARVSRFGLFCVRGRARQGAIDMSEVIEIVETGSVQVGALCSSHAELRRSIAARGGGCTPLALSARIARCEPPRHGLCPSRRARGREGPSSPRLRPRAAVVARAMSLTAPRAPPLGRRAAVARRAGALGRAAAVRSSDAAAARTSTYNSSRSRARTARSCCSAQLPRRASLSRRRSRRSRPRRSGVERTTKRVRAAARALSHGRSYAVAFAECRWARPRGGGLSVAVRRGRRARRGGERI